MAEDTCGYCEGDGKPYTPHDLHKSGGDYISLCNKCEGTGTTSIKEHTVEGRQEAYRKSLHEESYREWKRETDYMKQIEENLRNFTLASNKKD